jgi:hypothetical protein
MTIKTIVFVTFTLAFTAFSQESVNAPGDSVSTVRQDSADSTETVSTTDSLNVPENNVATDSLNIEKPATKLNKRSYNHREQIIFGSAMMAFLAIILTTVQNWNPD